MRRGHLPRYRLTALPPFRFRPSQLPVGHRGHWLLVTGYLLLRPQHHEGIDPACPKRGNIGGRKGDDLFEFAQKHSTVTWRSNDDFQGRATKMEPAAC